MSIAREASAEPVTDSAPAIVPAPTPPTPGQARRTPSPGSPGRTPLYEAIHAARYARQALIKEIEAETSTSLICYVAPSGQIARMDTVAMVDLLHNITPGSPIDLLLHSPGGDIDAAEKLITLVRRRAGKAPVRVIVPDFAKSAATLIALGANEILMSDSSELGAIDPQVDVPNSNGHLSTMSAQSYLDAFHLHAESLKSDPEDPVAALMLSKMEPTTVRKLERMVERSKSIAESLLASMIRDPDRAKEIAQQMSDTRRWHSHGQMISQEAATGLGLTIAYMRPEDPLWLKYWRLYCLQLWVLEGNAKLFEGSFASLTTT